ncbi:hypothetical protein LYZ87_19040, partial [Xanthomonas hortorum pv. vitians]|nr:hypothetical protein [Xanthomonas hortorum pv. vitians]
MKSLLTPPMWRPCRTVSSAVNAEAAIAAKPALSALEPVQSLPEISDHMEMRARYPSDISREQFEQIRALLEGARKKT